MKCPNCLSDTPEYFSQCEICKTRLATLPLGSEPMSSFSHLSSPFLMIEIEGYRFRAKDIVDELPKIFGLERKLKDEKKEKKPLLKERKGEKKKEPVKKILD